MCSRPALWQVWDLPKLRFDRHQHPRLVDGRTEESGLAAMNCISIRIVFADPRKIGLSLNRICNVFRDFQTELLRFQVLLGAFQDDGILGSGEYLLQGGGELLPVWIAQFLVMSQLDHRPA